ncbi:radical SAM protein [Polynucleobacter sphagniphilus]|uniref:Radical SAM core domain-containing protein n=1 Tax=Polynucleobacter sphagniphilus TaxID=1743169 RepID=A0AA43MA38_9BURK|nr:radical SAM protein [Polynucleobacter sphagniphilus]MDH6504780.1 hypothetical protein [Polynucleobacter sphagniphilus]MDH6513475.1 hypothetical protein [Polynucleobacter sphagniphilus]
MTDAVIIPILEIHVAHGCNLTCESCSHYSNQGHKGLLTLDDAKGMFEKWHKRVVPQSFSILGGEPTINPRLSEFLTLARTFWPHSKLCIITNGFFLHRHPTLPKVMREVKNASIEVSIHHDSPQYLAKINPIIEILKEWVRDYGIEVIIRTPLEKWTLRYLGEGATFEPFNDQNPRKSWEICPCRRCIQLFRGGLWKCPPLAYLTLQNEVHTLSKSWDPYLKYQPLNSDCSDEDLKQFLALEEESFCNMCPSTTILFKLPTPMRSSGG